MLDIAPEALMHSFEGDSADQVWQAAAAAFERQQHGRNQPSRDGDTSEILHASFVIHDPRQRWVVTRRPSINPAFAIAEIVWILRGRQDSGFLNYWNPKLPRFAGEGPEYDGAYGYRLRHQFGMDQIERAYSALLSAPDSRQIVLQIWDPRTDLPSTSGIPASPDVPCNVCSLLKLREGRLEWAQIVRSNDLFLGVPYNFVQFTSLQEVLAGWLGLKLGSYLQFSDSLHVYHRDFPRLAQPRRDITAVNTDTLMLPKLDSDEAFADLEADMLMLMTEPLTDVCLKKAACRRRPPAFQNFILVLAAQAARKKGWTGAVKEMLSECSNPTFKALCAHWYQTRVLTNT
jgi:thymidylate synthase